MVVQRVGLTITICNPFVGHWIVWSPPEDISGAGAGALAGAGAGAGARAGSEAGAGEAAGAGEGAAPAEGAGAGAKGEEERKIERK